VGTISKYDVSDKIFLNSREKGVELGHINNSITRGGGNLAGFIGEYVAQEVYGGELDNTYTYDLLLSDGRRMDVKTKRTSVEPKMDYMCTVSASQIKYDCDGYIFARVLNSYSTCWILGHISKSDFLDKSTFHEKGSKDEGTTYTYRVDSYDVPISILDDLP
jgi:hypothetical protein|tara:strand:- start:1233 stop:1718 length:486 start_codon:yes stop_codon:yes gene_type:complete